MRKILASHFIPLRERHREWQLRLSMIEEAQRFLYLTSYFVEMDAHGEQLLEALHRAAQRGVYVFLGLDGFGHYLGNYSRSSRQRAHLERTLRRLTHAGVDVVRYHPRRFLQRQLGAGQHVKIQLSDEGTVIIGSSNFSDRSFVHWGEFSAALRGPVTAQSLRDIQQLFQLTDGKSRQHLEHLELGAVADHAGAISFDSLFYDPNETTALLHPLFAGANPITDKLVQMIDGAQRHVRISSFHCKPTSALADALIRAARRGVQVELFHSHRNALRESTLPWIPAAMEYQRFRRAGIRIFESRQGEHSKLFLIDDRWAGFGSYNIEHAAHERLAELLLASTHVDVVTSIRAVFESLRRDQHVKEITTSRLHCLRMVQHELLRPWKRWL
jgi:cardiolipin synthase